SLGREAALWDCSCAGILPRQESRRQASLLVGWGCESLQGIHGLVRLVGHVMARRNQLGCNTHRNFFRCDGPDFETDWRMHPFEFFGRHTFFLKRLKNG